MILSIIIVSYNTADLTLQTVQSIGKSLQKKSFLQNNYEIIVVDNNSDDETVARLQKIKIPEIVVIRSKTNLGFGGGNNLGIKKAQGDLILFLNSDTVVKTDALERLVQFYKDYEASKNLGLVASALFNPDGSYQPQGGDLPSLLSVASQWLFWDDLPIIGKKLPSMQHTGKRAQKFKGEEFVPQGWVAGTAVLISKNNIFAYGAWDEEIFMYGEDIEWSLRLAKKDKQNGIVTTSKITHYGCASSTSKNAILGEIKGLLYVWKKYLPKWQYGLVKLIIKVGCILRKVYYSIKGNKASSDIYKEAMKIIK